MCKNSRTRIQNGVALKCRNVKTSACTILCEIKFPFQCTWSAENNKLNPKFNKKLSSVATIWENFYKMFDNFNEINNFKERTAQWIEMDN